METFRFAIELPSDREALTLLRELAGQIAHAAGLDDSAARRASDELVVAAERQGAGDRHVSVSFEKREPSGPVNVAVAGEPEQVARTWRAHAER